MAKAKYFVRVNTYWANSPDTWLGPYANREDAESAADNSGAGRSDLGQMTANIKEQTRILGIYNATESYRLGRSESNTVPAQKQLPGTIDQLRELEDVYLWY